MAGVHPAIIGGVKMLKEIEYKNLVENKYNPRKRFDDAEMVELAESIKKVGLLEPLVVRAKNGKYEVICGIRRYRALGNVNGGKVDCNVVKADDHQAMIMSFTENFERQNFTPMEEARFFAKALNIPSGPIGVLPGSKNQGVEALSKEIPSSSRTIGRRLMLLSLPEKVQNMVENKEILLGVAEIISQLRSIEDVEIRNKHMLRLAQEYRGSEPNMAKLKEEVESTQERYEEMQDKQEKQREELEKAVGEKEADLVSELSTLSKWYNETFSEEKGFKEIVPDVDVANLITFVDNVVKLLQEKSIALTTDETFDCLTTRQAELETRRDRLLMSVKIIRNENLDTCPFCGGLVRAPVVQKLINSFEEEVTSIAEQKRALSKLKTEVESYRASLRNRKDTYEFAEDELEKLGG